LINLDFTIISLTIAVGLYFAAYNIIRRARYLENLVFAFANLSFAAMLFIYINQIIFHDSVNLADFAKYFFCLLVIICMCIFIIAQIFPRWEKRPGALIIILLQIPGFLLIGLTLFTDYIIVNTIYNNGVIHTYGSLAILFAVIVGLYILGMYTIIRSKIEYSKNELFKGQLYVFLVGLILGTIIPIIFFIILPFYFNNKAYKSFGFFGVFFLQLLLNYSISGKRQIDFKNFYLKIFLWSIFIIILFAVAYWFIKEIIISDLISTDTLLYAVSIALPVIFFIIYRILRPVSVKILNIKMKAIKKQFDAVSRNIFELSDMRKQKIDWDNFYRKGINSVCEILGIETALFFFFNEELKVYELTHTYNTNLELNEIPANSDIINAFKENNIIEESLLYTDRKFLKNMDILLKFFNDNNIEAGLSILSYKKDLLGILLFGRLSGRKSYIADFISFLENYRIQFGILLENSIFSEEIRKTQMVKRDKMVVKNIKSRVIPANFNDLNGLIVSSLFVNNSEFGGDIFDTVKISSDKMGIYIANTLDSGVESSMLALQMSSVFHAQADMHDSSEGLLNVINKVICSSRFTEKYATAFYMIYNVNAREIEFSNAAFNPLIIFDPSEEKFSEFDAEGIPVGIDLGFNYKHRTVSVFPESTGLCYSHGVSSAIDKNGNSYSISRIKDIIRINHNDTPAELIRKIYADLKSFVNEVKLLNDITLIIFKTA
jgi:serine phosphatase RsbU (regulator of sigma subunit)